MLKSRNRPILGNTVKLLLCLIAIAIVGCGTDEPTLKKNKEKNEEIVGNEHTVIYFPMGCEPMARVSVPLEEGVTDLEMTCEEDEPLVAIVVIAPNVWMLQNSIDYMDQTLRPGINYHYNKNPDYYENSFENSFRFDWAELSTYKEPGSTKGYFRVKHDKWTPENESLIYIWLEGKRSQTVCLSRTPSSVN